GQQPGAFGRGGRPQARERGLGQRRPRPELCYGDLRIAVEERELDAERVRGLEDVEQLPVLSRTRKRERNPEARVASQAAAHLPNRVEVATDVVPGEEPRRLDVRVGAADEAEEQLDRPLGPRGTQSEDGAAPFVRL